jgi:hypothetical protein
MTLRITTCLALATIAMVAMLHLSGAVSHSAASMVVAIVKVSGPA